MIAVLLMLLQGMEALSSQGAAAMREKRWNDAVRIYSEAAARDPATPEWRLNLGLALSYAGRHSESIEELRRFLKVRSSPGPAHFVSGLAMLKLGRHCDAIPMLETARKWRASGDVMIELGDAYQGCKRWEQAGAAYEQALKMNPRETRIPRQLAHCWWMARRYEKALPAFRSIESQYGGDGEFLFEYGDTLVRAEGPEAGAPLLERAVVAAPGMVAARGALGRALVDLGRHADAIPHLQIAAKQDPAALLALSRAYRAVGRDEEASRTEKEYKARMR